MSIIRAFDNYVSEIMLIFSPFHLRGGRRRHGAGWRSGRRYLALGGVDCWNGVRETNL